MIYAILILIFLMPAIIGCLLAWWYEQKIRKEAPNEMWKWKHVFVASIISILFAITTGFTLFYSQSWIIDNTKIQRFQTLLSVELSDILRVLNSGEFMTVDLSTSKSKINILITYIQPLILEDAAESGLFDSVKTENMLHLAREIHMYNTKVSYFLAVLSSGLFDANKEREITFASRNVEDSRKAIVEDSNILSKQMKLSLSPSVNAP